MRRHLWTLSEALVPHRHVFDFNQALMDFGAMVCVARNPKCLVCPMTKSCRAFRGMRTANDERRTPNDERRTQNGERRTTPRSPAGDDDARRGRGHHRARRAPISSHVANRACISRDTGSSRAGSVRPARRSRAAWLASCARSSTWTRWSAPKSSRRPTTIPIGASSCTFSVASCVGHPTPQQGQEHALGSARRAANAAVPAGGHRADRTAHPRNGSALTAPDVSPTTTLVPGAMKSRWTYASAIALPRAGDTGGARHVADLPAVARHGRAGRGRAIGVEHQADEPAGDPAVTAMEHANDHFLADVAALRQADGPRLDAGLERDGLLVHVAMEERNAGLDPQRLRRFRRHVLRPGVTAGTRRTLRAERCRPPPRNRARRHRPWTTR